MGLFEFFGERYNPGNVGKIEKSDGVKKDSKGVLIIKSIIAVAILVGLYALFFGMTFQIKEFLTYIVAMFIYCIIGYWIVPKPDYSNVGLFGGFIDHPFRYSDDINRMLAFLLVILYPGRLITTTLVAWVRIILR